MENNNTWESTISNDSNENLEIWTAESNELGEWDATAATAWNATAATAWNATQERF